MIEVQERENDHRAQGDSALTDVARTLGGGAALGLLATVLAPAIALPAELTATVGAAVGLLGGFFIKKLDQN